MIIQRINHEPADYVELYRRQKTDEGFIYHALPWSEWADRIVNCVETQDFEQVYTVLIRTRTDPYERYYPLPRLLNGVEVPYYAEDAYQRVLSAIDTYTSLAKVATRKPNIFMRLKSRLFR